MMSVKSKNIHVLETDKPSRLWINNLLEGKLELSKEMLTGSNTAQNIYITSDEEIKEGWYLNTLDNEVRKNNTINHSYHKKIILTTDQDLIEDGVQAIDDEFLEWFVKNPSCESFEVVEKEKIDLVDFFGHYQTYYNYKIIIPKEEPKQICEYCKIEITKYGCGCGTEKPKQETLEEAAEKFAKNFGSEIDSTRYYAFINGAKWQQQQMYNDEDIAIAFNEGQAYSVTGKLISGSEWVKSHKKEWFEQFKKK